VETSKAAQRADSFVELVETAVEVFLKVCLLIENDPQVFCRRFVLQKDAVEGDAARQTKLSDIFRAGEEDKFCLASSCVQAPFSTVGGYSVGVTL